jgi:nanoRNase/pAp phosphatase (c-di-AMP/oligoRNAs hydrolase)
MRKIQKPKRRTKGRRLVRIDHHGDEPTPFEL